MYSSIVFDVDQLIADQAGATGAMLADSGRPTDLPDLLIAATALVHGLRLVTHNTQDFAHVPGLALAD